MAEDRYEKWRKEQLRREELANNANTGLQLSAPGGRIGKNKGLLINPVKAASVQSALESAQEKDPFVAWRLRQIQAEKNKDHNQRVQDLSTEWSQDQAAQEKVNGIGAAWNSYLEQVDQELSAMDWGSSRDEANRQRHTQGIESMRGQISDVRGILNKYKDILDWGAVNDMQKELDRMEANLEKVAGEYQSVYDYWGQYTEEPFEVPETEGYFSLPENANISQETFDTWKSRIRTEAEIQADINSVEQQRQALKKKAEDALTNPGGFFIWETMGNMHEAYQNLQDLENSPEMKALNEKHDLLMEELGYAEYFNSAAYLADTKNFDELDARVQELQGQRDYYKNLVDSRFGQDFWYEERVKLLQRLNDVNNDDNPENDISSDAMNALLQTYDQEADQWRQLYEMTDDQYKTWHDAAIMAKDLETIRNMSPEAKGAFETYIASQGLMGESDLIKLGYAEEDISRLRETWTRYQNNYYANKVKAFSEAFAKKDPVTATGLAFPVKLAGDIAGGLQAVSSYGQNLINGSAYHTLDPNAPGYLVGDAASAARGQVSQMIQGDENASGARKIVGKIGDTLYTGVNSLGDNVLRVVAFGEFSPLVAAAGSLGDTTQEASRKGASPNQAFLSGLANAATEYLTEKVSVDRLLSIKGTAGAKAIWESTWKSGLTEVSEEEASFLITLMADNAILGNKSDYNIRLQELIRQGMTKEQAEKQLYAELTLENIESSIVSFGVGAAMGGGTTVINSHNVSSAYAELYNSDPFKLVGKGMAAPEGSRARALAEEYQAIIDTGKSLTKTQIQQLMSANAEVARENTKLAIRDQLVAEGQTEQADPLAQILVKLLAGEKISDQEQAQINSSAAAKKIAWQIADGTFGQQATKAAEKPAAREKPAAAAEAEATEAAGEAEAKTPAPVKEPAAEASGAGYFAAAPKNIGDAFSENVQDQIERGMTGSKENVQPAAAPAEEPDRDAVSREIQRQLERTMGARVEAPSAPERDTAYTGVSGNRYTAEQAALMAQIPEDKLQWIGGFGGGTDIRELGLNGEQEAAWRNAGLVQDTGGRSMVSTKVLTDEKARRRAGGDGQGTGAGAFGEVPAAVQDDAKAPAGDPFAENVQSQIESTMGGDGITAEHREMAKRLAAAVGKEVVLYNNPTKRTENGYYKGGKIYVNVSGLDPMAQTVSHELTHSVENADAYKKLSKVVIDRLYKEGRDLAKLRRQKMDDYAAKGVTLTQEDATKEIVAEFVAKNLLTDLRSIQEVTQEHPSLARRILGALERLIARFRNASVQERAFLDRARNLYATALEQSAGQGKSTAQESATAQDAETSRYTDDMSQAEMLQVYREELDEAYARGELTEQEYDAAMDEYLQFLEAHDMGAVDRQYSYSGNGYDGYSMSNNARAAYESGEKPISKWTKVEILKAVREIDPEASKLLVGVRLDVLRKKLLSNTSWHHTSMHYNKTDFYSIDAGAVAELTAETVAQWQAEAAPKAKAAGKSYRGDINYIEWSGTRKHPKANKKTLTDVNIEERGSFYIVTDDAGNELIRKKIGSNGTSVTNHERLAAQRQADVEAEAERKRVSTPAANALYDEMRSKGREFSGSGNIYFSGRKPSHYDYDNGLENFFEPGEKRLSPNGKGGYLVETWNGTGWDKEPEDEVQYSLSQDSSLANQAIAANDRFGFVSKNVMTEAKKLREYVAGRLRNMKENGTAIPDDIAGSTAISNSAYDITEENTTICPRSLAAEAFTDAVSEYLGRPLSFEEQIYISQDLQGRSLAPECVYCYVATDRKGRYRDRCRYPRQIC